MSANEETIRQLTETVQRLAEAQAQSEVRHRRTMRVIRWVAVAAVCVSAFGLSVGGDAIRKAEAANGETLAIAQQLAQLNQTIGQMAQGMGQMFQSPGLGKLINNGGVLAERLKQDSDALRFLMFCQMHQQPVDQCAENVRTGKLQMPPGTEMVTVADAPEAMAIMENMRNVEKISQVLGNELVKLNNVLEAVPQMRNEMAIMRQDMSFMSAQMGVMAGSMGTTMGRMGKWIPW